ncbi:MAG: tRNA (adenine(22)-N(1))-methyltransferase TrmK, partial [Bacillus sp. (in: firmicutes)]
DKLTSVKRLVLQPNISAISIRKWFIENNWELIDEEILEEDGKIYEILIGEKGDPNKPYKKNLDMGLLVGPFLLQKQDKTFKKKRTAEINNWQRIYEALESASQSPETNEKKQEMIAKIKLVEEALKNENS